MKKKRLLTLLASAAMTAGLHAQVAIDAANFPDDNFRSFVSSNFDTDSDGSLSDEEIAAVTWLGCGDKDIADLKGIEHFTALEELYCNHNQLTSLDVSNCTALERLHCEENQLTSLDVSNNTALMYLDCGVNQLSSLDVSNNTVLLELSCFSNQLTSLDVSNNTALEFLVCGENALTSLDVSNNTALVALYCFSNQLTSLDVSNNTALEFLACFGNNIGEAAMNALAESLPANGYEFFPVDLSGEVTENNVCSAEAVRIAAEKGWTVKTYDSENNEVYYFGSEPTLYPVSVTAAEYATYYNSKAMQLPAGVKAATVDGVSEAGQLTVNVRYDGDDAAKSVIPAGTAVLLQANEGSYTLTIAAADTQTAPAENLLRGSDEETTTTGGDKYYKLTYDATDTHFGFYWGATDGGAFTSPARKAYLALPASSAKSYAGFALDGTSTAINMATAHAESAAAVYTLDGRRVNGTPVQKGIYVVGGKKRVIK